MHCPATEPVDGCKETMVDTTQFSLTLCSASLPMITPAGDTVTLTLRTEGWNPKSAGVSQDGRDLGVMLDWVEMTSAG